MPDYFLFFGVWIGGGLWFFFTNKVSPGDNKQPDIPKPAPKKPAARKQTRKPIPKRKPSTPAKPKTSAASTSGRKTARRRTKTPKK